jgi:16S rRNA (guanine527-N7)-methyltransferase
MPIIKNTSDINYYNILKNYLNEMDVNFSDEDVHKIIIFLNEIFNFNNVTNIVGSKTKDEIFHRHIMDCISIFSLKKEFNQRNLNQKTILDIGTGAGLPGILFSILLKNSKVFLLEKNHKKVKFLSDMISRIDLDNTYIINYPAEHVAKDKKYRESFDFITARAVAKINILLELIIPFSKINGKIFLYKSRKVFLEVEECNKFIKKLGCEINKIEEIKVPYLEEFRAILIMDKITKTPKIFPRDLSLIKKANMFK